jgi:cysteine sulfinate desulfinase/cysteine desulfurase-like protein
MGIGIERAVGAVRLSVGIFTTEEEVRHATHALITSWRKLKTPAQATGAQHGGR